MELDQDISRVAIYGAIGDYCDNTPMINELLNNWDKRELYLEAGILIAAIDNAGKRNYAFKKELLKYLSENKLPSLNENLVEMAVQQSRVDEEMRQVVKREVKTFGRISYVINIGWSLGKAATYARAYGNTPVGIAAEEEDTGIDISIRSVKLRNLHRLVSRTAEKLRGVGGGIPMQLVREYRGGVHGFHKNARREALARNE
ncbi:MAG: hypothetical protein ACUVQ0_01965 [Thermoproteota archaeon]